jgi:hypothetical protein
MLLVLGVRLQPVGIGGGCDCNNFNGRTVAGNLNIYPLNSAFFIKKPPSDGRLG